MRADRQAEAFDGYPGLRDAGTTRRDGVQDDDGAWVPGERENLLRGWNCLKVVDLRPAWNDDQVGDASRLECRGFRTCRSVYDDEIDALRGRGVEGVPKAYRLGVGNDGNFREAAIVPAARGRLGVDVNHRRGLSRRFGVDREEERQRCLPRSAFLRQQGHDTHTRIVQHEHCTWLTVVWCIVV